MPCFQHSHVNLFFLSNNPCEFFGKSRVWDKEILSPLLFAIVLDALSRMLDKAVDDGCISGFSVGDTVGILLRYLISTLPMIPWYSAMLILISFCLSSWFFSGFRSIGPENKFGQVGIGACGSSSQNWDVGGCSRLQARFAPNEIFRTSFRCQI